MPDRKWLIGNPVFEVDKGRPEHRVWPWNGHRLFAYDLVRFMRPTLYVELGTYWGTSFFAICQAVKDSGLPTRCVAVDSWLGDTQTGPYDEGVYGSVRSVAETLFAEVDFELIRSLFHEAVHRFGDGSIDLLHIDGLHSYEAVRADFESWLPKLAENGVVLFHDIAESCDYGSVRFWRELAAQYPSFSFQHSWGLGVLFPKGRRWLDALEENNLADKRLIYEYRAELELARIAIHDLEGFNAQQDHLIKHQEKELAVLDRRAGAADEQVQRLHQSRSYKLLRFFGFGGAGK